MKHILLVDMNAFFIMCESLTNKELLTSPAAVAGDPKKRTGIILTANYEARKWGVYTTMTVNQAKKVCPNIILVKPTKGLYTEYSKKVFEILNRYTPIVEKASIDEGWLDITKSIALFGSPYEIATKIISDIKEELGLWCSVGISENKFLAKMACDMKKPLGITSMYKKDIPKMLWPLKVEKMYGVGKSTRKLLNRSGIYTIENIAKCDKVFLNEHFGSMGLYMYDKSRGIDNSIVTNMRNIKSKSISRAITLEKDTVDVVYAKKIIMKLAQDVGLEARKKKLKGSTVQITLKYNDFTSITRQKKVMDTNLDKDIIKVAYELLDVNFDNSRPVRLIGVGLHNMAKNKPQISFFENHIEIKEEKIEKTIDSLNERYGKKFLKRGSNL